MKKITIILLPFIALCSCTAYSSKTSLPIIPGEQVGLFGMDTPAGSGRHLDPPKTTICRVKNLNDTGHGSLRYCIEDVISPKVIVFEVSGNIELKSNLWIKDCNGAKLSKGNYVTIAGQTAPSPGVTLKNYGLRIYRNCHDVLVQHLRIRPGDTSFYDLGCERPPEKSCTKPAIADPIVIDEKYRETEPKWTPPYNIVIDHNSFSWGGDMNGQSGGNTVTFSNNIFSEALANPLHVKGPHSKGLAVLAYNKGKSGAQKTAIVRNLFIHNWDRNPYISAGSSVIANNLIYDAATGITVDDHAVKKGPVKVSIVGNYIIDSERMKRQIYLIAGYQAESRVYVSKDNYISGKVRTDPWNYSGIIQCSNWGKCTKAVPDSASVDKREDAIWPKNFTSLPIEKVKEYVLNNAGARPADRGAVDSRVVKNLTTEKTGLIESQKDVGGWPELKKNRHTLNIPKNHNQVLPSGYTRLEEWLHGYSRLVEFSTQK